jgi:hypothetical protein
LAGDGITHEFDLALVEDVMESTVPERDVAGFVEIRTPLDHRCRFRVNFYRALDGIEIAEAVLTRVFRVEVWHDQDGHRPER